MPSPRILVVIGPREDHLIRKLGALATPGILLKTAVLPTGPIVLMAMVAVRIIGGMVILIMVLPAIVILLPACTAVAAAPALMALRIMIKTVMALMVRLAVGCPVPPII
jgi:hypothetical protein